MLSAFAISVAAGLLVAVLLYVLANRRYMLATARCVILHPNREVRVSLAALLCARHDGRYLLVRNFSRPEEHTPFGGVFKFYDSARDRLDALDFRDEPGGENDWDDKRSDLRGYLPAKNLPLFMKWFESRKDREGEPITRELSEELRQAGLGERISVPSGLQYELVRTCVETPHPVPGRHYLQFRFFEVYRLSPQDIKAQALVRSLFAHVDDNPHLIAVTKEEIIGRRSRSGSVVGGNAGYLVGKRPTSPEPAPIR